MKYQKIAFLDRDGVINSKNINSGYVGSVNQFRWIPGAKRAIKILKNGGFKIVVVSNQSGVARNFFKISDVYKIHKYIQFELHLMKVKIDAFYFCPYHQDGIIPKYKKKSSLRKPNIGMFKLAQKRWNIDKKNSFIIGDQKTDMLFAKKAKIKGYLFKEKIYLNLLKLTY